jgi:hypothetical protein
LLSVLASCLRIQQYQPKAGQAPTCAAASIGIVAAARFEPSSGESSHRFTRYELATHKALKLSHVETWCISTPFSQIHPQITPNRLPTSECSG